jgi:hypothetical protein
MLDSVTTIVLHCAATLPESAPARKELLVALGNIVSIKHPAFDLIRGHLSMLEIEERLQKELPLQPLQPPTHDGQ